MGVGWPYSFDWAFDDRHIVYTQDAEGDEDYHVNAVDVAARTTGDLTPFAKARAWVYHVSRERPAEILIALNRRDPKYTDLYSVDLASGTLTLVSQNSGFQYVLTDNQFALRLAVKAIDGSGLSVMRAGADGNWTGFIELTFEEAQGAFPFHVTASGDAVIMKDNRGRDTAALTR
ncbi:MAG: S9 family peptidase, partial [Alphaproteobacteria bacterium]|nr:S9 family peptidase [Alphaproteobacteria bacterium]